MGITIKLKRPHINQQKILDEKRKYNVVACGRRFGKTTLAVFIIVKYLLEGQPVAYFTPNYRMQMDVWREIKRILRRLIKTESKQEKRIELINGARIDFYSLHNQDVNACRSKFYKAVLLDECAYIRELEEAWTKAIMPTLIDLDGDAYFLSTPLKNYFYKLFCKEESEKDSDVKNWKSFKFTSYDNPKISRSIIDEVKIDMPEAAFMQEHLAEFIDDVLGVFRGVLASLIARELSEPEYNHNYVFGVDLAKKNDFTVVTILDADTHEVVKIERFNQIDYVFQVDKIVELANKWKPKKIVVEENNIGTVILELLERKGVKNLRVFSTNNTSKKEIIEALSLAFEQFQIFLYEHTQLLNELSVFETKMGKGGTYTYSAPEGSHDDCVISLALAFSEIAPYREAQLKPVKVEKMYLKF